MRHKFDDYSCSFEATLANYLAHKLMNVRQILETDNIL